MYDDEARKLAVKVIGTVESNLDYGAVNYNDPITVGIAQWYGVRAAAILHRMMMENGGSWYDVEGSISHQVATIPTNDPWWNSRYLTFTEGSSLVPVMERNVEIQNDQLTDDLEEYVTVAVNNGIDKDANTATMIYFFSMYHQGPVYAFQVLNDCGPDATLDEIHTACLANPVLGQYGSRYNTTYNLISEFDFSGIEVPPPPDPEQPNGNASLILQAGDVMIVQFKDGERIQFYPSGHGQWMPRKGMDEPTPVQPPPPPGTGTWVAPLTGNFQITSGYGPRAFDGLASFHYGVDLANPASSPGNVVAPTDLVISVAASNYGYGGSAGNCVKGHTTDGAYTFCFYHLASLAVSPGQTVSTGAILGVEGATGNTFGQHLHFEAYEGNHNDPWPPPYGNPVDPLPILRAHGVAI